MDELFNQTRGIYVNSPIERTKFTKQIAFNCIPHIDVFMDDGYTKEEWKMSVETKKILDPKIKVTATCVRVPVFVCHAEAVNIEFERPLSADEARSILKSAPGVAVIDHRVDEGYVTQVEAAGEDKVYVSRIRDDHDHRQRPLALGGLRQPAQGRRAQRGADRREAGQRLPERQGRGLTRNVSPSSGPRRRGDSLGYWTRPSSSFAFPIYSMQLASSPAASAIFASSTDSSASGLAAGAAEPSAPAAAPPPVAELSALVLGARGRDAADARRGSAAAQQLGHHLDLLGANAGVSRQRDADETRRDQQSDDLHDFPPLSLMARLRAESE